jgi:tetratricopeptide (TPR) repeat protein
MKPDSIHTALIGYVFLLLMMPIGGVAQANSPSAAEIRAYMDQAQRDLRDNQPDAAIKAYQAVLRLDPNSVDARADLGVVAMSTGNWSAASEQLDAALKIQPSNSQVQALLGLCDIRLGRTEEAERLLSDAFPMLHDPKLKREAGLTLVEIEFETGELEKASAFLLPLEASAPGDAAISYAAFRVYSELTFRSIQSLAINAPNSPQLHRALAEHMVNDGRTEAAIIEYRKALAITPDSFDLHYELGQALIAESHQESNLAEAQKEFESSIRLKPGNARCECQLAEVETLRSNPAGASSHFVQALKFDPDAACAKAGLASQLIDEGKNQQALDYLQAAVRSDPYDAQIHYHLATLYRQMGNKDAAAKEMDTFKELRDVADEMKRALHPDSEHN